MSFVRAVKLRVPSGAARPGPAIGQALGPLGINMAEFCKQFNEKTETLGYKKDIPLSVTLNALSDRSFTFDVKTPPTSYLLKKAAGMDKGTNGDYPFKFGTFMGCDAAGNRYYENRVDYPFGQHRWVEPGDIHNFDSASIPPEWHGWMTSMNDAPPAAEEDFIADRKQNILQLDKSSAGIDHNVGHQEEVYNFHHLHNLSTVRSRGYGIGNPVVGLPPFAKDSYYTQPGSPYNPASIRPRVNIGDLDEAKGGGRPFKSQKWADRLRTPEEKAAIEKAKEDTAKAAVESEKMAAAMRKMTLAGRGAGTVRGA